MESEYINRKTKLIEYTKIHIISLEQDLENIAQEMESLDPESKACKELDYEYNHMSGQILSARYLLKTMEEML
jgi:hypothetical protein